MKIYPVILAGGSGARLWPLSREKSPKQLLALSGEMSLIKLAVKRCHLFSTEKPIIVTTKDQIDQIKTELINDPVDFIAEPERKNTAPAIALAAGWVHKKDPKGIIVILTSDQFLDEKKLAVDIKNAAAIASKDSQIILIGIEPTSPETGYGYICLGEAYDKKASIYKVKKFAEKPDLKKAKEYLASGDYLWNAGMFLARADVFKKEIDKNLPELSVLFKKDTTNEQIDKEYKKFTPISVDYGVIEKTKSLLVVKTDMEWSDLGSWSSVHKVSEKDSRGNSYKAEHLGVDNDDVLVISNTERLVATIGLKDIAIIDTEDALLVCNKTKDQNVKQIVDELKSKNRPEVIEHKTSKRPWGRYTILDEGEGFKVKFIHVNPGEKLSLQSHKHRAESWTVVKGVAKVTLGSEEKTFNPNENVFIDIGELHRLENVGKTELTIVEVATGKYIAEDDIQRFDDIYSRA